MYVITKKRLLIALFAIIIFVVGNICYWGIEDVATESKLTVVIDAGHGGIDCGVVGRTTGVKESDINLAIALKLGDKFKKAGINTVLTRQNSNGLYGMFSNGFKKRDMQKRAEIISASKPDLVISIHANQYKNSTRRGIQVFYSENKNSETHSFAMFMQDYLDRSLNIDTLGRRFEAQCGDFFIIKCNNSPGIIIECGFLSNESDEKLLIDNTYQDRLAYTIFSGAIEYLGNSTFDTKDTMYAV